MSLHANVPLETHSDARGNLVALESQRHIPFEIKRVYYLYDVHQGASRGYHAHRSLRQMMICVSGSCQVLIDDGQQRQQIHLNDPAKGLLIEGVIWREMHDFSPDCVLLVLADQHYDEADYIRDYSTFLTYVRKPTEVNPIIGKNLVLRLVQPEDASFVLDLRTQARKARHLSKVDNDLVAQRTWLEHYKTRERRGEEYYFVIEDKQGQPLGLVRIYDLGPQSFSWGSWIIGDHAPRTTAIKSALQVYEFGFDTLGYRQAHFDVRKANTRVVAFHQRFGATIVDEDHDNYYFRYQYDDYLRTRYQYRRFLP